MSLRRVLIGLLIGSCLTTCLRADDALQLGNAAFAEGHYAEAITHYKQALREEPTFEAHANLGHTYMKLKQWPDATASYRAALALETLSATGDIWFFLGQAYYQNERYREALDAFLEAGSTGEDHRSDLWIARCLVEMEQWLRATFVLRSHLGRNPANAESLELLAHICGQMDDWSGVVDAYHALLAATPLRTEYRVALAHALALGGRNQEAIDTLELARRLDGNSPEKVHRLLADLYLAEQMSHEAAACYARVIQGEEHPSADDYLRLGMAYFHSHELVSARTALNKMRQINPEDFRADLYLGHIATEEDRTDEAERHFKAVLNTDSASAEALLALAQLLMRRQQYAEAASCFGQALESGIERPEVYASHIQALLHTPERAEEAGTALKAALARHPSNPQLQQLLDRYIRQVAPGTGDR